MALHLDEIVTAFEKRIPLSYQEEWDTSGLQVGSRHQKIDSVLFALDVCKEVISAAQARGVGLVVTHHPMTLRGFKRLDLDSYDGQMIRSAIQSNIAIYSAHTNHDASLDSLNYYYGKVLGLTGLRPLKVDSSRPFCKIVVFIPEAHTASVLNAVFSAGAGHVGAYSHCSFRSTGTGTFLGEEGTNPFQGRPGELEQAGEYRAEVICPRTHLEEVVEALIKAHPYEEVAYDILPLENHRPQVGLGVVGDLKNPTPIEKIISLTKKIFGLKNLRFVGKLGQDINRVALCTGSGASLMKEAIRAKADLFITGDVKYHVAVEAKRSDLALLDVGHFASEIYSVRALKNIFEEIFGNKLKYYEYNKLSDPFILK